MSETIKYVFNPFSGKLSPVSITSGGGGNANVAFVDGNKNNMVDGDVISLTVPSSADPRHIQVVVQEYLASRSITESDRISTAWSNSWAHEDARVGATYTAAKFVCDTAGTASIGATGHFTNSAGDHSITCGAGNDCPKIVAGAMSTLTVSSVATQFGLASISGNGASANAITLTAGVLSTGTYDCTAINVTTMSAGAFQMATGGVALDTTSILVGGTATSTHYRADYPPANMIDGNINTFFAAPANATAPVTNTVQIAAAKNGVTYSITARQDFQAEPGTWYIEGSNDGTNWTQCDYRAGITWTMGETKSYTMATPGTYSYWRIRVTVFAATYLNIAELKIFGYNSIGYPVTTGSIIMSDPLDIRLATAVTASSETTTAPTNTTNYTAIEITSHTLAAQGLRSNIWQVWSSSAWRQIVKLDGTTWKYNSSATTTPTWTAATVNNENYALSQAISVSQNQMTPATFTALTAANWAATGGVSDTDDLLQYAKILATTSSTVTPTASAINVTVSAPAAWVEATKGGATGQYDVIYNSTTEVLVERHDTDNTIGKRDVRATAIIVTEAA